MTGAELLVDMIRSKNEDVLNEYGIELTTSMLSFTDLYAGEFEDGSNTKVGATARGTVITGTQVYYYTRPDVQAAFKEIGVDTPEIATTGTPNASDVLAALRSKHNFQLDLSSVMNFKVVGNRASFDIDPNDFVWTGSLIVSLGGSNNNLAEQMPNNVLNGFYPPDQQD